MKYYIKESNWQEETGNMTAYRSCCSLCGDWYNCVNFVYVDELPFDLYKRMLEKSAVLKPGFSFNQVVKQNDTNEQFVATRVYNICHNCTDTFIRGRYRE